MAEIGPLQLSDNALTLNMNVYLDVESGSGYDQVTISVVSDAGETELWNKSDGAFNALNTLALDISAHAGQEITIRVAFDTVDTIANSSFGVVVDDVSIGQVCAVP